MAGAGYKLFNTGDVLTAAQVNTYLQEQVVMRFATTAARTTALSGVLAEGMVSYIDATDTLEVYNGSAWVSAIGDITEVQAGTGITVTSGTGPIPSIALTTPVSATNGGTAQTTYATGDLLYASAANTLAKRAIGTTGQVLTVSGGVPTWATPAGGGGKVLQVVQATYSTATTIASTTYTDTGLSASITPSATTSKVLVLVGQAGFIARGASNQQGSGLQLVRGATTIHTLTQPNALFLSVAGATEVYAGGIVSLTYLDSPSTTSSTTYKTQARVETTANSGSYTAQRDTTPSVITLLEIGA